MKAAFQVDEDTEVECEFTLLGLEVYRVNGVEVLRTRSARIHAVRKFQAGPNRRNVEIRLDLRPAWKSVGDTSRWTAQAFVDGKLVASDLTPVLRKRYRSFESLLNKALVAVGVSLVLALLYRWLS